MWINSQGQLYAGDCIQGDREATDAEISAYQASTSKAAIQSQIDALETGNLMPRATREFMLLQYAAMAGAQNPPVTVAQLLDPTNAAYSPAFAKLEALDQQVKALRSQL